MPIPSALYAPVFSARRHSSLVRTTSTLGYTLAGRTTIKYRFGDPTAVWFYYNTPHLSLFVLDSLSLYSTGHFSRVDAGNAIMFVLGAFQIFFSLTKM